jgi:hypothetical protein
MNIGFALRASRLWPPHCAIARYAKKACVQASCAQREARSAFSLSQSLIGSPTSGESFFTEFTSVEIL